MFAVANIHDIILKIHEFTILLLWNVSDGIPRHMSKDGVTNFVTFWSPTKLKYVISSGLYASGMTIPKNSNFSINGILLEL